MFMAFNADQNFQHFFDRSIASVVYCLIHISKGHVIDQMSTVNSEIFARISFSQKALKDIFATFRDYDDLPSSVNDRVIAPFRDDFIFTKLRICDVSRK